MTDQTRYTVRAWVRTSPDLVTWTDQPTWEMQEYSEGQCQIVGSAAFRLNWGTLAIDGTPAPQTVSDVAATVAGQFVQILTENVAGSVTVTIGGLPVKFSPCWHGIMLSPKAYTTGTSGVTDLQAAGIGAIFQDLHCRYGRILKSDGTTMTVLLDLVPFNQTIIGERASASQLVGLGSQAIYPFDLRAVDTSNTPVAGNNWQAYDILQHLLACNFAWEHPPTPNGSGQTGILYSLDDPQGCLAYVPRFFDPRGKTLFQALCELASNERGITWQPYINAATGVLHIVISSGLLTAITATDGAISATVPANPNTFTLDTSNDPWTYPVNIEERADRVADEIIIRGGPCKTAITLGLFGTGAVSGTPFAPSASAQLGPGWTTTEESEFLSWAASATPKPWWQFGRAFNRFLFKPGWDGFQYGGTYGLWNAYAISGMGNSSFGDAGFTLDNDSSLAAVPFSGWLRASTELPCSKGFLSLNASSHEQAIIMAEDYTAGTWVEHTGDWGISVEETPPAVLIDDRQEGRIIAAILAAGRKILVTIGIEEWIPWQCSWVRPGRLTGAWPRVTPRTKTVRAEHLGYDRVLQGAVTGAAVNGSFIPNGSLATATALAVRNDSVRMLALLAQARAFHEDPFSIATWTDRGNWDIGATKVPGTLLTTVNDGVVTRTCNAMVTRRTVKLGYEQGVPYWSTSYQTDVIYPTIEAFL